MNVDKRTSIPSTAYADARRQLQRLVDRARVQGVDVITVNGPPGTYVRDDVVDARDGEREGRLCGGGRGLCPCLGWRYHQRHAERGQRTNHDDETLVRTETTNNSH